jgi:PAS domain S-box-containing protein
MLLLGGFLMPPSSAAQHKPVRRVLILNEVNPTYPVTALIDQGIRSVLEDSTHHFEIYREYLDTIQFPDGATQQEIQSSVIRKYRNRRPDVIITVGPGPLRFMMKSHDTAFPGIPVVFCLPNGFVPSSPIKRPDFVGIENDIAPAETLAAALRLEPATKHVVVIGGVSALDRQLQSAIRLALKSYEDRLDISYWTDFAMPDLLQRLQHLPVHTVVILINVGQDTEGTRFSSSQSGPLIVGAANAPVFSLSDVYLGHGEVGGNVSNILEEGKIAGGMARRILAGEKPGNIATAGSVNTYMFDLRALQRWGMSEKNLPPGSIVLNRAPSFWQLYEQYIVLGVGALVAQTLAIFALLWQRAKRRKMAAELRESRLRLEGIVENAMDAMIVTDERRQIFVFNAAAEKMFGCSAWDAIGNSIDRFIPERFRQTDGKNIPNSVGAGITVHTIGVRGLRTDGEEFPMEASISQTETVDGKLFTIVIRDITERLFADEALKKSEQRSREMVLRSPVAMMILRQPQNETEIINHEFIRVFGYSIQDVPDLAHWWLVAYPDHAYREAIKAEWQGCMIKSTIKGECEPVESTVRCKDGSSRIVESHFSSLGESPVISFIDFTDRQRAESALRESEERFRLLANVAPVMIWMTDPQKACDYFNETFLDFTGRSLETELGNGWLEGVHQDDQQNCWNYFADCFDRRNAFSMEYRLRRHDGEYRWVFDMGVPRFNADNSFAGYIGCAIDVTARKEAEEALSSVSRRLIEAHEEERTWIARELHDDINQRIALLSVQLLALKQKLPAAQVAVSRGLEEAYERSSELGSDIQALSHRLHSSKLDFLGLVAAAKSVCKEISNEQQVEIVFQSQDVPRNLPSEVSLCLFRVLQEALQNAVKHSGARNFEVSVAATPTEIDLSVRDSGIGFDPEQVVSSQGLGLTSMKERLRLVNGWLSVESKLEHGTTIQARVPLGRNGSSPVQADRSIPAAGMSGL